MQRMVDILLPKDLKQAGFHRDPRIGRVYLYRPVQAPAYAVAVRGKEKPCSMGIVQKGVFHPRFFPNAKGKSQVGEGKTQ